MRSVTYSMGVSLDGYIVGPDGGFGWTPPDEEVFRFVTDGNTHNPLTDAQLTASAQLVEVLSRFAGFPLQVTDSVEVKGYGTHVMGGAAWGGHTCPGPGPRAGQRYEIISRAAAIRAGQVAWTSDGSVSLNDLAAQLKTQASSILQMTAIHDGAFASDAAAYINGVFAGTTSPGQRCRPDSHCGCREADQRRA